MKLSELNPLWFAEEGRTGQGVIFDCPRCRVGGCGDKPCRLAVAFTNPLDGGTSFDVKNHTTLFKAIAATQGEEWPVDVVPPGVTWLRAGETFETLTVSPSIHTGAAGHWHGHLTNGDCSGDGVPGAASLAAMRSSLPTQQIPTNACAACRVLLPLEELTTGIREVDGASCLLCRSCAAKKSEGARTGYAPA